MTVPRVDTVKILLTTFQGDEAGTAAIEYAMIAGLNCVVIIADASATGRNISKMMSSVANKTAAAAP
jgi:Flp pilus assembly pilin Flp